MRARVRIRLKPGVLDPEAKAIQGALHGLGFASVAGIVREKHLLIDLHSQDAGQARAEVEAMCAKLLANPVIENFDVQVES